MSSEEFSLLQTWDLVLGTLFFSRLALWLLWDQLTIVTSTTKCLDAFWSILEFISRAGGDSFLGCFLLLFERFCTPVVQHFFGASDVFDIGNIMSDILRHKMVCGVADGSGQVGRVHIDNACVQVFNDASFEVLGQLTQCYGCPLQTVWQPKSFTDELGNSSFQVNTRYPTQLKIRYLNHTDGCSTTFHFEQFGLYQLNQTTCNISTISRPVNAFLPIFWSFVILCFLIGLRLAYQSCYKTAIFRRFLIWLQLRSDNNRLLGEPEEAEQDTAQLVENAEVEARQSRRVRSLDAFRGLSITVMIFVNYGGGSYYFFNHSPWNGLTVADLVFPWFIWIMGVSLAISTQSQLRNSVPREKIVMRVIKRSIILMLLGLVINSEGGRNDLRTMRIPGVLQRFGLTYLVVGVTESQLMPRQFPDVITPLLDVTSSIMQWILAFICLGLHTLITFSLPVPGCPNGYLGPGGLADNASHPNCTGGAAMWVDVSVFGLHHIYQHPTSTQIYHGTAHDPEGLLGVLTSMFLCWLGVAAGRVILVHKEWSSRVTRWLTWALITGLVSGGLSEFSLNNGIIPINKNLWSLSFILATGSMAFTLLTIMYLLIDVYRFWSGSPFIFPGMNSILMYMGHEIMSGMFPWSWKPFTESHAEMLAMNMWGCGLWILTSFVLYQKKLFLAL